MTPETSPLRIWCLILDQLGHVRPVEECFGDRGRFIYDAEWDPDRMLSRKPDLVLCVNDYPYAVAQCLDAARRNGIPSLVLQDGILEWRCQYENPLFAAGGGAPQHQPVLADKIACIGAQSARQMARWGNRNKVEITGMPRLDHLASRPVRPPRNPARRVLVMTAKKPGFTAEQVSLVLSGLRDVKARLDALSEVEVIWRTRGEITAQLGVPNSLQEFASLELTELIESVDAVITTPSTAMLEGMLLDRPVAALDYHNTPRFVPTAWTISAPAHIADVLDELLHPPLRKMAFQRDCLEDCLACDGPASERVRTLIERMTGHAAAFREGPQQPGLPADLLGDGHFQGSARPPSLRDIYPDQEVFSVDEVTKLQVRLARLQKENGSLKAELQGHTLTQGLRTFGRHITEYLRTRDRRN